MHSTIDFFTLNFLFPFDIFVGEWGPWGDIYISVHLKKVVYYNLELRRRLLPCRKLVFNFLQYYTYSSP